MCVLLKLIGSPFGRARVRGQTESAKDCVEIDSRASEILWEHEI